MLAMAAGAGNKTWHAYLSENGSAGHPTVNARERIGNGPAYAAKGALIRPIASPTSTATGTTSEKDTAPHRKGRDAAGARRRRRTSTDILTGSQPDGLAYPGSDSANTTCG